MKLIVGLGNPGKEYATTRHNAGFMVLDKLSHELNSSEIWKEKHHALLQEITYHNQKILLAKPQTYMNNSGTAVAEISSYYNLEPNDLLIVYDDFDIPLGEIRIRQSGSSGGHNGMNSIIEALHTEDIPRMRLGIGNQQDENFVNKTIPRQDYVLTPFSSEEKPLVEKMIGDAVSKIPDWLNPKP